MRSTTRKLLFQQRTSRPLRHRLVARLLVSQDLATLIQGELKRQLLWRELPVLVIRLDRVFESNWRSRTPILIEAQILGCGISYRATEKIFDDVAPIHRDLETRQWHLVHIWFSVSNNSPHAMIDPRIHGRADQQDFTVCNLVQIECTNSRPQWFEEDSVKIESSDVLHDNLAGGHAVNSNIKDENITRIGLRSFGHEMPSIQTAASITRIDFHLPLRKRK